MVHLVNMGLVSVDIAVGVVCIIIFCIQIRQGSQTGPRVGILIFMTYFSSRKQSCSFRFVVVPFSKKSHPVQIYYIGVVHRNQVLDEACAVLV